MVMDLYYSPSSAPCRACFMTAKAVGVELNKKLLNLMKGEQLTPEFIKINPQHTIPTLVDDGFAVWESRAIMIYLAEKYGKDDSLYPKCPQKRAIINQRMFFDMNLYSLYGAFMGPQFLFDKPEDPEARKKFEAQLEALNTFLEGQTYVAGDSLTLADIILVATVTLIEVSDFDMTKYPNVVRWREHCKKVTPGFAENWLGKEEYKKIMATYKEHILKQAQKQ